jgi:hypothetical protein
VLFCLRSHSESGAFFGDSIVVEVPGVVHHELKVVVTVDAHGHVVVVLNPFGRSDSSVSFLHVRVDVLVVLLEGIEELHEHFIFGFISSDDAGVFFGVVSLSDITKVEDSTIVFVKNGKGSHSEVGSELVHFTSDSTEELFVVNHTVVVGIKEIE